MVVLYGSQGAASSSEQLQLTNQLFFDAAAGELAVVAGRLVLSVSWGLQRLRRYLLWSRVSPLGTGSILRPVGLLLQVGRLRLLVHAPGPPTLEIVLIFTLDPLCVLLRFSPVGSVMIAGFSLILLSDLGWPMRDGLPVFLCPLGSLLFVLYPG